ncbi:LOW QUALITY PROTEIN: PDZ and LIM domain protein Zasp [Drosophila gunungcola]|uniref:LOW QUALITY PROTEIN: PDZ and LIM domain protein Zasp n=1 Tax=Drosophila gunungcola TaxID=103775 RepID=UPI0022E0ED9F|nr:LOW QUALITY PROTEIN: PDZ and LIM domain protein Zasp [Drosophila gunungcola]
MAQPQLLQVKLSRFDAQPWGFRLQGGTDFAQPLLVQKVNAGSLSEQAGLQPGDAVVKINDVDVFNLRHKDAQDIVVRSGNNFVITVQRGGSTWRPHVTPTGNVPQPNSPYLQTVTKTSLAHKQQDSQHIGCGYNNAARPFSNGGDGGVKSIVNKQYNTPVGIYSDESIAETLSAQAEVLAGGVLGVNFKKNEKEYQGDRSEVLKFLREEETGQSTPEPHSPANFYWTQSHAIGGNERRTPLHHQNQQDERIGVQLQSNTLAPAAPHRPSLPVSKEEQPSRQDQEQADPRIIVLPICPSLQGPEYKAEMEAAAAALANDQDGRPRPLTASGHPACQLCGVGIVGVFVRIKDKNLHVECFKCATCGTSLKNQGYYNFNNKLYCDIHAKQAAINNPPTGTEGYVPVPIKPNTKLSASTISTALNSHGYGGSNSNGYSNGNSAPAPVNQGYARPFGAAAPKSPVASYPPQQQQQSPRPAPGGNNSFNNNNPYATLPRSNVGQQAGEAVEELQPEYEEEDCFEMDIEVALAASRQSQRGSSFTWPPPQDDSHLAPTAAPLYIPPPETQHVVVSNPVQQVPPLPPGGATARLDPQPQVESSAPQWQSYSAPQLTTHQLAEQESSSDSYTSTSTTTTTTSEEYQRMYAAQIQAYQMQEQSGSEFDYQVDYGSTQDSIQDYASGRRSAQECVDSLAVPLSTYKLVDMVREVTPSPVTTPTQTPAPAPSTRRVVFNDEPEIKELPQMSGELETIPEEDREGLVIEQRCQILESERKFQPTPEIKIEIAPVRQIPPTKIPNPMPKEWINPMIRVLTTAPEVPFHLVECPFPRPCGDDFEEEAARAQEVHAPPPPPPAPAPPAPAPAPVEPLRESPPRGSRLTQAMVTAPEFELKFAPPADQGIPLPEETEPYMPPPIEIKPYLREDYRPKSPFVSALTTAPDRPFEGHFDKDVPIHMIDLPTPKEHLSMCDALCTAPDRGYTPLNPENAMHRVDEEQKQQELKKHEFQVLDHEEELGIRLEPPQSVEFYETRKDQPRKSSAFAAMQAFQPSREPLSSNPVSNAGSVADTPRASIVSALRGEEETDLEYQKYCKAQQRNQKRLDSFHKKEEELNGLQGQQLTQLQRELSNQQQSLLSQQQLQQSKLLQLQQCAQSQELQQQIQQLSQKSQQQEQHVLTQQQQPPQQQQPQKTQQQQSQSATQRTQQQQQQVSQVTQQQQQHRHSLLSQTTLAETQTLQAHANTNANAQSQSSASYSSKATACSNSSSTVPPAFAPAPAPAPAPPAIAVQSSHHQFDAHELIEETAEELEHSEVLFPPPSPLSHLTKQGKAVQSGLHKADSIPKYQRNWTVLPTQSPIRTPEPQELRENVPLAFVDAPKAPAPSDSSAPAVHRPIAQAPTPVVAPSREKERERERRPQLSVPIIIEDRSGPVTMAFQPLDELVRPDQALTPTRPYTPSLTNKPAPIVPFYQTEEKLVFEECSATHARNYNELSASPFPDRTRSPAPGPPPNPLNAIRAPRMKEPEPKSTILSVSGAPRLQTGSITTGQSYQGQLLAHSEQSSQSASQSFSQQPERITEQRVGNLSIQQREQSSQLQQQAQSQSQSQTRSQVGNTQIERRRKVTEEFERTQSAKTIEIRTGSQSTSQSRGQSQSLSQSRGQSSSVSQSQAQSQTPSDTERRSSYGKTGFVANQAKRLSCLEQEISSLTSQSQAISARASALGEGCFPNLRSPTFDSKFPLKPASAESIVPGYGTAPLATEKLMAPPPGFILQQQQQQRSAFSGYQATTTSSVQQNQKTTSSSLASSSSASASASASRSSQSLTQASAITTTTNNQATMAYRSSNGSTIKPNLASRPSIASITAPGSAPAPAPSAALIKAKAPIAPKSVIANAVNAAAPPAPAVFPPDLSDLNQNSNVDDSAGAGNKSAGAFGATSAPKRGRGILNKAAGPGVRIPLCNSCNVQIRGPFITALGRIWCPDHFICVNGNCRRPLQDIGFVEEKGDLYCEYCFEKYLAPTCSKCAGKIKGDCLNAIGKHFHPECFTCGQCGKIFGNRPFFLEDGNAYCEADWNELFTTKCFACGFPVEAGDRWVEALNHNYHSQCFNCTFCKQNLEGQSFYNKGGRPFCKNHAR